MNTSSIQCAPFSSQWLCNFHNRFTQLKYRLPSKSPCWELHKRIGTLVIAPFAYLILGFTFLITKPWNSRCKKKIPSSNSSKKTPASPPRIPLPAKATKQQPQKPLPSPPHDQKNESRAPWSLPLPIIKENRVYTDVQLGNPIEESKPLCKKLQDLETSWSRTLNKEMKALSLCAESIELISSNKILQIKCIIQQIPNFHLPTNREKYTQIAIHLHNMFKNSLIDNKLFDLKNHCHNLFDLIFSSLLKEDLGEANREELLNRIHNAELQQSLRKTKKGSTVKKLFIEDKETYSSHIKKHQGSLRKQC